ncbi:unnamed protein product (macronuclear) [Paramecium tetraurelia]|uniref:Transmembrane protein n=1 Tax=Paramecium tetraurelia TaxID=5888 RepID=A0DFT7_PARTE|nr:uncharacterized protein GSPATT00016717001 [Paramecium tetraurelia]CAK81904.1 unnamed protein product [Paramecium tetraurelia]|eukprot:XP_001449301.1 hypothetical protein (macronuclear) [Paramecium tetraurelia strain d4-2]
MILCVGDIVPPTTEKAKVLRRIIFFIIFLQICLALGKLYYDMWAGVAEFTSAFILWCAQAQLNYCNCVIYIFFCLMNTFLIVVNFMTDIQNKVNLEQLSNDGRNQFLLQAISLTFYIVSVYFTFQAYKEFKGIAYDVYAATTNDHVLSKSNIRQQIEMHNFEN